MIELKDQYYVKCSNGPAHGQKDEQGNPRIDYTFEYIDKPAPRCGLVYDGTGHIDDIPFHFFLAPGCDWLMMGAARGLWLEKQVCELFPEDCPDGETEAFWVPEDNYVPEDAESNFSEYMPAEWEDEAP
jgi:hypothetical protein